MRQLRIDEIWNVAASNNRKEAQFTEVTGTTVLNHFGNGIILGEGYVESHWPEDIDLLDEYENPYGIEFECIFPFSYCTCETECNFYSCDNARVGIFCLDNCCRYSGLCGNRLILSRDIKLVRSNLSMSYGVIANTEIEKGLVLGQYIGVYTFEKDLIEKPNKGYRLIMKAREKSTGRRIIINADEKGNITRYINHSCKSNSSFYEMSNMTRTVW